MENTIQREYKNSYFDDKVVKVKKNALQSLSLLVWCAESVLYLKKLLLGQALLLENLET